MKPLQHSALRSANVASLDEWQKHFAYVGRVRMRDPQALYTREEALKMLGISDPQQDERKDV